MTVSTPEMPIPRVVSVTFTNRNTRLTVELDDGRIISAPLVWFPRLLHGLPKEKKFWRLTGPGHGIHWPQLDEDISVMNLLAGQRSAESQRSLDKWLESRETRIHHR